MMHFWLILCSISYLMGLVAAAGNVILIAKNVTLPFDHIEATFAPPIKASGISGMVSVAEPLDACSPLRNEIVSSMNGTRYPFVLMIRGGCTFEHKVRRAQAAGFEAAIIYDNVTSDLVAMAGNPMDINIYAVFVTKVCGETLANYAGAAGMQLRILPGYENPTWSMIALSLISLLGISAVLVTCFFVRRHRFRPRVREFHGISSRLVKAMPSLIFTAVLEDNCTSQTCAICLEDYNVGEKLRVLPCRHKFHAVCVDTWLTSWRTFCPICKRDAKTKTKTKTKTPHPPPSESTPLLSLTAASSSSSSSSSPPPPLQSPPPLLIGPPYPISSITYNHHSGTNQSSISHNNISPLENDGACVASSDSTVYTSLSILNSRYILPYARSPERMLLLPRDRA